MSRCSDILELEEKIKTTTKSKIYNKNKITVTDVGKADDLVRTINEISYYSTYDRKTIYISTKYDLIIYFKEFPKGRRYSRFDTYDEVYDYAQLFNPIKKKIPMEIVDAKTDKVVVNKKQFEKNYKEWLKKNKK